MKFIVSFFLLFLGILIVDGQPSKLGLISPQVDVMSSNATTGFTIEYVRIAAGERDLWFNDGDCLEVEMKATPGMHATFMGGKELVEVDPSETGVKGIYRGQYVIRPEDKLWEQLITFSLYNPSTKHSIEKKCDQKISFLTNRPRLVGLTNSANTSLFYGLGSDRLGGAKMGVLDSLIKVEITGKRDDMYRVRLSENVQGYIPTSDLHILSGTQYRPQSLTGSWTVRSDGKNDFVSIAVGQRLPYVTIMEEHPARIVVDIFGAVSNSNWITQRAGLLAIKNVWYEQVAKDQFRAIIELKDSKHWGYDVQYIGNALSIRVKPKPKDLRLKALRIAIDAGHGGTNLGAVGLTGAQEKDINLAIAQQLKTLLTKKGAKVIMTRSTDVYTSNPSRLTLLKEEDPDLLISIHCNAAGSPKVQGTSTYYRHQAFRALSQYIQYEMLKLNLADFGNVGGFNFTLNAPTAFPTALVEVAFLSNPEEEEKLVQTKFQEQVARQIVKGLENFLKNN